MAVRNRFTRSLIVAVLLIPSFCLAQAQQAKQNAVSEPQAYEDSDAPAGPNGALLAELEAMRRRLKRS